MKNKYAMWVGLLTYLIVSSALAAERTLLADAGLRRQEGLSGADEGRLQSVDLARRSVVINGYRYQVSTGRSAVEVSMLGSSAGAMELLVEGMYVRVEYRQVRGGRISTAIQQLKVDRRMDH
jgi:hypothetical protein